jgi:hypothetical protein
MPFVFLKIPAFLRSGFIFGIPDSENILRTVAGPRIVSLYG